MAQDQFATKAAEARCQWAEKCDALAFYGETLAECRENLESDYAEEVSEENCPDYDGPQAWQCVRELGELGCVASGEEPTSACDLICAGSDENP